MSQTSREEMGNTILGDVTHPTPIVVAGSGDSGLLKTLVGLAIGAMIPTAGVGGFLASQWLTQKPAPTVQQSEQNGETLELGLGKLSDFLQQKK